jgi:hypothetical protein
VSPITSKTTTTLGTLVLVAGATWTVAGKWFGYQKDVATQMAVMNAQIADQGRRLVRIERALTVRRDDSD